MKLEGHVEYRRRQFCKDLSCPIQILLEAETEGAAKYEQIRSICRTSCIHTTYEFHHWLIHEGYLIVRPVKANGKGAITAPV